MSSAARAPRLLGNRYPRIQVAAPGATGSYGELAVRTARAGGLRLDPWQADAAGLLLATTEVQPDLELPEDLDPLEALELLEDHQRQLAQGWQWATVEAGLVVPRQNGKGAVIEAIVALALFVLDVELVIYSAHEFKTALEFFRRFVRMVRRTPAFRERVARYINSHGEEGIELREEYGGGRLRILARSGGSGRGFSAPLVILDEAYALKAEQMAALMPTIAAMANPLVLSFSSAGRSDSEYLHALKRRAEAGEHVTYLDWSVDPGQYGGLGSDQWAVARRDPHVWALANPSLGRRMRLDVLSALFGTLSKLGVFDREMLGVFDPEPVEAEADPPGPLAGEPWAALADQLSEPADSAVAFVVDVAPGGRAAAIAMGAVRADGDRHLELVDYRPGTAWIPARIADLEVKYPDAVWLVDPNGPAVQFLHGYLWDHQVTPKEAGQAYAELIAGVRDGTLRWRCPDHLEDDLLRATDKAQPRIDLDAMERWSRRRSPVDICPLVAMTLAGWAGTYIAATGDPLKALY